MKNRGYSYEWGGIKGALYWRHHETLPATQLEQMAAMQKKLQNLKKKK
tara:strand:- start:157 stop:300 length:144 start_codon:yes stop_codon:yes gene_type:complete